MRDGDFELVASCIRRMRSKVQTDLDQRYAADCAIVLAWLAEQLADDFAARYPRFERDAFLAATTSSPIARSQRVH